MPVHERDVADAAVAALLQTGQQGQGYDLSDPELITRRDQVGAIATAIGAKCGSRWSRPSKRGNTTAGGHYHRPDPTGPGLERTGGAEEGRHSADFGGVHPELIRARDSPDRQTPHRAGSSVEI